jgi:tetratricopeptide (TPR) repeat protein
MGIWRLRGEFFQDIDEDGQRGRQQGAQETHGFRADASRNVDAIELTDSGGSGLGKGTQERLQNESNVDRGAFMQSVVSGVLRATALSIAFATSAIAEDTVIGCTRLDAKALDQNIAACTALIQSKQSGRSDPTVMLRRGMAYHLQGQYRRAIADYDVALKIARGEIEADILYYRGVAKLRRGDTSGGKSDVSAAKLMRPNIGVGVNMMALSDPAFALLVAPADVRMTPRPSRLWLLAPSETK